MDSQATTTPTTTRLRAFSSPRSRYVRLISDNKKSAAELFGPSMALTNHDELSAEIYESVEEELQQREEEGLVRLTDLEWTHRFEAISEISNSKEACGKLFNSAGRPIRMAFVNREREVAEFVSCLVKTQVNYITDTLGQFHRRCFTPFLDQMFGSGKTTLAMMALECARKGLKWESESDVPLPVNEYGRAICREIFGSDNVTDMKQFGDHETTKEDHILKRRVLFHTVESLVVRMDFTELSSNFHSEPRICYYFGSCANFPQPYHEGLIFTDIVNRLLEEKGKNSILIVMDEVHSTTADQIRKVWQFMVRKAAGLAASHQNRIQLHFVFCGRQTLFASLGTGGQSPTRILWIPLPALKFEHVKTIVKDLQETRQFPKVIYPTRDTENYFFKRLLETTGGIPRILEYVFEALSNLFPQMAPQYVLEKEAKLLLIDELEIDYIFDVVLFTGFAHREYVPDRDKYCINGKSFDAHSEERRILEIALGALLLHAETDQPIDIKQNIAFGNSTWKLGDLLNYLPLFLDTCGTDRNQLKIQKSQYVMRILSTTGSISSLSLRSLLSFLCSLNRHEFGANITQDSALLFELLLASRIVQHIQVSRSSGCALHLSGLNNVLRSFENISSWTVPQDIEFVTGVWPKVTTAHQNREGTSTRSIMNRLRPLENRLECTPEELSNEIRKLLSNGKSGVYVFMVRGKSGSADLYVILVDVDNKIAIVLGVQAKSGKRDPITDAKLKKEWEKFWATCPQQILGIKVHFVLIVAARDFSKNVSSTLRSPVMDGILHFNGSHRYFVSNLDSQQYLVSIPRNGLSSENVRQNRGLLSHLSSIGIHPCTLQGIRPPSGRTSDGRCVIALPISQDKKLYFSGDIIGFTAHHTWTELEGATILPSEDNYHILLWNESTISRFVGDEVWKQYNKIKENSDNPQQLVKFILALVNGDNRQQHSNHPSALVRERERGRTSMRSQVRDLDNAELIAQMKSLLLRSAVTGMDVQHTAGVSQLVLHQSDQSVYGERIPITAAHLHGHKENRPPKRARTDIEMDGRDDADADDMPRGMDISYDSGVPHAGSSSSSRAIITRPLDPEERRCLIAVSQKVTELRKTNAIPEEWSRRYMALSTDAKLELFGYLGDEGMFLDGFKQAIGEI